MDRNVWVQSSKYVKYDQYGCVLHVVTNLINNIIMVGKYRYIGANHEIGWLPNKDFNPIKIMSADDISEKSGIQGLKCEMKCSKRELDYYK
ncbi:MAG: hypothetical protein PHY44_07420 [Lachnospiraceae bacterium]|nr:hypothetical protein [Lachnospiraceae bacterium]